MTHNVRLRFSGTFFRGTGAVSAGVAYYDRTIVVYRQRTATRTTGIFCSYPSGVRVSAGTAAPSTGLEPVTVGLTVRCSAS